MTESQARPAPAKGQPYHPLRPGKTTLLVCLFLATGFSLPAQNTLSTGQILAAARNDQRIRLHERQLDFLKNENHALPWSKGLEFRTETNELDPHRQEYLLRFRYHTKAERKAHQGLHFSEIQLQETEQTKNLEAALLRHYFLLVKYFFLEKEIALKNQQRLLAADRLLVLRKKAAALADTDLDDLFAAEEKSHLLEREITELEAVALRLRQYFATATGSAPGVRPDTAGFLTLADLTAKLPRLPQSPGTSPDLLEHRLEIERTELQRLQEKAENSWKVDYVQFRHSGRERLSYVREWSFGLGIEIPLKETNRLTDNAFALERLHLENDLALEEASLAERLQEALQELELKLKLHDLAARQLADSQLKFSHDNYPAYPDADPLVLLSIKANLLKRQADQLEIEKDIYLRYLEIIEWSGKTIELPLRDYLNRDWAELE